jgi:hypothetical protein
MGAWGRSAAIALVIAASCTAHSPSAHRSPATSLSATPSSSVVPNQPTGPRIAAPLPTPDPYHQFNTRQSTVEGVVRDRNGLPIFSICVSAYEGNGGDPDYERMTFLFARTDRNGRYRGHLTTGGTSGWALEFWDCATEPTFAPREVDVVQRLHQTRTVNAVLDLGGAVSGTARDNEGNPLPNICVDAFDGRYFVQHNYLSVYSVRSRPDGSYRIGGLAVMPEAPTGVAGWGRPTTKILFGDCGSRSYFPQWWGGRPFVNSSARTAEFGDEDLYYEQLGTTAEVQAGSTTLGVDAALTKAGIVTGHVDAQTKSNGLCFVVDLTPRFKFDPNGQYAGYPGGRSEYPGATNYQIGALLAGDYTVAFRRYSCGNGAQADSSGRSINDAHDLPEIIYFNQKSSPKAADVVTVTQGQTTSSIDCIL